MDEQSGCESGNRAFVRLNGQHSNRKRTIGSWSCIPKSLKPHVRCAVHLPIRSAPFAIGLFYRSTHPPRTYRNDNRRCRLTVPSHTCLPHAHIRARRRPHSSIHPFYSFNTVRGCIHVRGTNEAENVIDERCALLLNLTLLVVPFADTPEGCYRRTDPHLLLRLWT